MAAGSERYYLDTVASGREEYYTGGGEAPGVWLGAAGRELGLSGEVTPEQLRAVLGGCSPFDGSELNSRVRPDHRVAGFDFTFSAPKSVSVLHGLGADDVSVGVRDAHDEAVRDALLYMETHAAYARRGHAGAIRLETAGLVAAGFRHRTSRAGDPQLLYGDGECGAVSRRYFGELKRLWESYLPGTLAADLEAGTAVAPALEAELTALGHSGPLT